MKRLFQFCSLLFLAVCAAGCGKDSTVDAEATAAEPEPTDFDSVVRRGIAGVARKDADAATAAAAKALESCPYSAEAHLLAGQAACLRKDFDEARRQFSLVALASLPAAVRAKAYVGLGTVDFAQGQHDMSLVAFLRARLLDAGNEAAWYYLGRIYNEDNGFRKPAEDCFKKFAELSEQSQPGNSRAKNVKENILPEIARSDAQAHAVGGNGTQSARLVQQAKLQESKAQLTKAKKNYEEALKLDPQSHVAAQGYARLVGKTENTVEGVRKAIRAYGAAIALNPDALSLYREAGRFAYQKKRYMQAVEIMKRAIAYHPGDLDSIDMLVGALKRVGSTKLATAWGGYRDEIKSAKQ